ANGTTANDTTANDTTANDTDGPPTDQYVACEDPVCDNGCVTFNHFEVCAIPCTTVGAPCAIHVDTDDGQYPLTCASLFAPICVILCDSDADCPKGTTCTTDNPVAACMYPGR
ncbi:MAG: hypothetical protein JKY37_01460, partial [Nannocystaceae bacterium]|nr:hypothetical protein [Nannocystaceae bacterium]